LNATDAWIINIVDSSGRLVLEKAFSNNIATLNFEEFNAGIYYLSVLSDGKVQSKKILIQR